MAKEDKIEVDGKVVEVFAGDTYSVKLDGFDAVIRAQRAGKMKMNKIELMPGDAVKVELNPYDPSQGRITFRQTPGRPRPEGSTDAHGKRKPHGNAR